MRHSTSRLGATSSAPRGSSSATWKWNRRPSSAAAGAPGGLPVAAWFVRHRPRALFEHRGRRCCSSARVFRSGLALRRGRFFRSSCRPGARGSLSRHLRNRLLPNRPRRRPVDSRVANLRRRSLRMPNQPLLSQQPPSRRSRQRPSQRIPNHRADGRCSAGARRAAR
jgi:hypothetical protein